MFIYLYKFKKYLHNITPFSHIILLISLLVVSVFFYKLAFGWYPAKYTESAHGIYANRSAISSIGYAVGHCAHCHDQHASIEGTSHTPYDFGLFAPNNPDSQDDNFCFQCHDNASSVQAVTNYSYSKTFGGGSSDTPDDIKDAFAFGYLGASGSSHNLADVLNLAIGRTWGYTASNNACTVCHNPHTVQDNTSVEPSGHGGVKTAVINPSQHGDAETTNLWGDEPYATSDFMEMMTDFTASYYQAPYYVSASHNPTTGPFEPANDEIKNGSNLPFFGGLCRNQCHRTAIYSTERSRNLYPVNWTTKVSQPGNRNVHGKWPNDLTLPDGGYTIAPYVGGRSAAYVLACTDCHEPHGSTNRWLLRTTVNGKDISTTITDDSRSWYQFCAACHVLTLAITTYHKENAPEQEECNFCHTHNRSGREGCF